MPIKFKATDTLEQLTWHDVRTKLPDSDTTVLVCAPAAEGERVSCGWYEGRDADGTQRWKSAEGYPIGELVTDWADLPHGPQQATPGKGYTVREVRS